MAAHFLTRNSLKTRITVGTLAIFVLGIWLLAFHVHGMLRDDIQRLVGAQEFSTITLAAGELDHEIRNRLEALETVAAEIDPATMLDRAALQRLLESQRVFVALFNAGVLVLGKDGTAIADVPLSRERVGANYLDLDAVTAAIVQGRSTVGRPIIGKTLRAPLFPMAVPIRDQRGSVIGALAGATFLGKSNFLDQVVANRYGRTGGYMVVVPGHRLIVSATDKRRVMEVLPAPGVNPLIDRFLGGYEGTFVMVNPLGQEVLASSKRIPSAGWNLSAVLPTKEAFAPIYAMRQRVFQTAILLTLLAGVAVWWMLRRQLSPMLAAVKKLEEQSARDAPAEPLPVGTRDEIGELITGFNGLLANLRQREAALRQSEENLSITLQSIGDAVIATDANGIVVRMNPIAERLSGWPSTEAVGRPLSEVFRIVNARTRETVADPVREVISAGEVVGLANDTVLVSRDGREFQIADSAAPIRGAAQAIVGVVLVFSDVTDKYRLDAALEESEERYRTAFRTSPDAININRLSDGLYLEVNDGFERLTGWAREDVVGRTSGEINIWKAPEDRERLVRALLRDGRCENLEADFVSRDGSVRTALMSAHVITLRGDQCILSVTRDISERKAAEEQVRKLSLAVEQSLESIVITNTDAEIEYVNEAFVRSTGYRREEVIGRNPRLLHSGKTPPENVTSLWSALTSGQPWRGEFHNRRKDGTEYIESAIIAPLRQPDGRISHYVAAKEDITAKKIAEDRINTLAFFDPLTELPNRRLLLDRLTHALASSLRNVRFGALLFIDLDNFKTLNDTLGHDIGDLLLKEVARRLVRCVREGDTVARLGGDEFVVMLEDLSAQSPDAASQARRVAEKIIATFEPPFQLDRYVHQSTPSIGVTLFADRQHTVDDLLRQADLAMYQAKAAGRNTLRFFDPAMQATVSVRAALEADLREAIAREQFLLFYQIQVDGAGRVTGVEALLRWQQPGRGLVPPGEFIALAEDTGLILPIGLWVLRSACRQLAEWAKSPHLAHLSVSVNVSARQFHHRDFVGSVLSVLGETGADPQRLKLELTESLLVDDIEDVGAKMASLKARGVGFALDDFGTGYSSLSYLKRLPLDELKIDRGFVRDVLVDPNDAAIARAILALARNMGIAVVAEGVESEEQREFLAQLGCQSFQGYLFGRPRPASDCERMVAERALRS